MEVFGRVTVSTSQSPYQIHANLELVLGNTDGRDSIGGKMKTGHSQDSF